MTKHGVSIDSSSAQPLYLQIRNGIRESIRLRTLKSGEKLPTERDLAVELGVSVGMVRRALSLLVDEGLIYRRPQRGTFIAEVDPLILSRSKSKTIGVVFQNLLGAFMADVLKGVSEEVSAHEYHTITCDSNNDPEREMLNVDSLIDRGTDGLIIFPVGEVTQVSQAHYKRMLQTNLPFVLIDRYFPEMDTDYVVFDNRGGAYAAVKYLADQGHTRIGHITIPQRATSVRDRFQGYVDALTDSEIVFDPALVGSYSQRDEEHGGGR